MKHKNNYKSGLFVWIWIWIMIITATIWLYYTNSSANYSSSQSNNKTFSNITSTSCPMMRNGWWCWWAGWWCGWNSIKKTTSPIPSENNVIKPNITYETLNIWHDEYNMIPEIITLSAWKSYKLIITPSADGWWCMNNMTIPGIDENIYDIKKNIPITIIINNAKAWNYNVVCGNMWMYQWQIIIK